MSRLTTIFVNANPQGEYEKLDDYLDRFWLWLKTRGEVVDAWRIAEVLRQAKEGEGRRMGRTADPAGTGFGEGK